MIIEPSRTMKRLPEQFFSRLVSRANQYIKAGYDVINLGQGDPDLPTPPHIVKSLQQAAENPVHHRYPPFTGLPELKEAVASWYKKEQGVELEPEQEVAILFGAKAGLVEISQVLLNPGDVALVPDPGYPDYWSGIAIAEAEMVPMPLLEDNAYLPDLERITSEQRRRAKLMFLNYPANPTGACAEPAFFDDVIRFAEENNIVVAHDFAYGAIGFDNRKPASFLTRPGAKEVGVEFYTMSKTYNMAGWRVAFAVGNRDVIRLIEQIQDHYHCSIFGALQEASITALTAPQDCVRELVDTYESRRNAFYEELDRIGWKKSRRSKGSFFVWVPVPDGTTTSTEFANRLVEEAHVVVAPGVGFGEHGEGYIRIGLLDKEERIREAVRRMGSL
ncbi:MAG: pyridoxal phosphate-dependent aminotransferase [Bacillaceae bacterium]|nr:pyridoxal phosphate-dependent aminotransferase [Bacillaceae bacterium]